MLNETFFIFKHHCLLLMSEMRLFFDLNITRIHSRSAMITLIIGANIVQIATFPYLYINPKSCLKIDHKSVHRKVHRVNKVME